MYNAHPHFWLKLSGKKSFYFFNSIIYLFIFRNKTNDHIPGHYFAYGYCYCFLELHFWCTRINKRIKNIYLYRYRVPPMYNEHPYFFLKNLGKKLHIIHGKIQYLYFELRVLKILQVHKKLPLKNLN